MRHEHEAEAVSFKRRIASCLVVAADGADLEPVPGRDRAAVELEEPQPQPTAAERLSRELAVEGRVAEVRRRRAPARPVEGEEGVEVTVERRRIRESRGNVAFSANSSLAAPELLAEVPAPRGQVLVPRPRQAQRRTRLAPPLAPTEHLVPVLVAGELLAEEDIPVEPFERGRERVTRGHLAASLVHGAELVARTMAEEADHAREATAPGIEGEDGRQQAVGRAHRVEQKFALATEVLPPEPAPQCGREDASRPLGEGVPLPLEAAESVHGLRARYNFRGIAMTDVRTHPSIAKRVVRPAARLVGVPMGVAFMLLLKLTSRKVGVALMYHSVGRRAGDPAHELVPPHEVGLFEDQLRHVVRHYDVVPADRLLEAVSSRRRGQRFPVVITFDDDLACHATLAAPVLRNLGAHATFFLSGASLDRPFSFHFERLQRAWDRRVPDLDSMVTGDPSSHTLHELGGAMVGMSPEERDGAAERLLEAAGPDPDDAGMRRAQVRALVDTGMTVGFHTYRHDPLTGLTDTQLADALRVGRSELEEVTGAPVDVIGYPHGRADERVAAAARAAGFRFGYCTRRVPVTPTSSPWLLGRFGPSVRSVGALALELAFTLLKRESAGPTAAPERAPS